MKDLKLFLLKHSTIILTLGIIFNLSFFGGRYYYYQSQSNVETIEKIKEYFKKNVSEKNVDIKFKKDGELEINQEFYLFDKTNFPLEIPTENLVYISKDADLSSLKSKNTFVAINNNKVFIELNGEQQVYDIWNFIENSEIIINSQSINNLLNEERFNTESLRLTLLYSAFLEKTIFISMFSVIFYFAVKYLTLGLLKLSGYMIFNPYLKSYTILILALLNFLEPGLTILLNDINFYIRNLIPILFIGIVLNGLLNKKEIEPV
jgi:hypothetical protein